MRHQHKYIAIPITGRNVCSGKETLFHWRAECETCHKPAPIGVEVYKIVKSWWAEIVPKDKLLNPPIILSEVKLG